MLEFDLSVNGKKFISKIFSCKDCPFFCYDDYDVKELKHRFICNLSWLMNRKEFTWLSDLPKVDYIWDLCPLR